MATSTKGKAKSKTTATKGAYVSVILSKPQAKTKTVRYDSPEEDAAMRTAYVTNEALAAIGNPAKIKVTIEAA